MIELLLLSFRKIKEVKESDHEIIFFSTTQRKSLALPSLRCRHKALHDGAEST